MGRLSTGRCFFLELFVTRHVMGWRASRSRKRDEGRQGRKKITDERRFKRRWSEKANRRTHASPFPCMPVREDKPAPALPPIRRKVFSVVPLCYPLFLVSAQPSLTFPHPLPHGRPHHQHLTRTNRHATTKATAPGRGATHRHSPSLPHPHPPP
jgi:hypothetical protein